MDAPNDPMGPLVEGSIAMHELFLSYVAAGFTEEQATQLCAAILTGMMIGMSNRG